MNAVYVKLVGGIGNQLFQAAAGYAYSKKHNIDLILDDSEWVASQGQPPSVYKNTVFRNFKYVDSKLDQSSYVDYHEPEFNYNEIPVFDKNVRINGYFQSLKYFESFKDEFISELILPESKVFTDSVAVHIRRGDYIRLAHVHYVCDTEYFLKNFKKFPDKNIHVFTDSPEFVITEFENQDIKIIKTESELIDLVSMSNHDNMICSNSSFSWWASLLGIQKHKIIVPSRWFNNFQKHDDIYRTEFILSED